MVDIKETVKAMCDAFPGGRSAMAGALGMSRTTFDNNLYEKNGCRFFEFAELEAMQEMSGTTLLAEYNADKVGLLLTSIPRPAELDRVELFNQSVDVAAKSGHVDQQIQESIADDGVIDADEQAEIMKLHMQHLAARDEYVRSVIALHKKVDARSVQLQASGASINRVE
ncbi:hypothetical protein KWG64_07335 [Rahnella sp. PD12R]|uniref:YmfL family putative regulatory protein n=1 Tax=Rahnella sp. PD12R TaxID=2855688 RepID=UPI001C448E73|nr:YmfL family putative regulatory protein [Rahnella sp. PD12R]MBV6817755.1 hypothetical protein [Rahnella sp. PD12R]